jgi:uncharacterized phage protein (TIGR02220 family)
MPRFLRAWIVGRRFRRKRIGAQCQSLPTFTIVSGVIARMNELAGTAYEPDSKIVINGLVPRLTAGASEADCLAVVEDRWHRWHADPRMRQYFNPETIFREHNFEKYKNTVRMGRNSARLYGSGEFVG